MKLKQLVGLSAVALCLTGTAFAQSPEGGVEPDVGGRDSAALQPHPGQIGSG